MRVDEAFPSAFLKASDLKGSVTVTIKTYDMEAMKDGREKPALSFREGSGTKKLILNITNAKKIASAYGPDMDDWIGKKIILYPTTVEFSGEEVEAIRVRIPDGKTAPAPAVAEGKERITTGPQPKAQPQPKQHTEADPPPRTTIEEDLDDEIPW